MTSNQRWTGGRGPLLESGEAALASYSRGPAKALAWWSRLSTTRRGELIAGLWEASGAPRGYSLPGHARTEEARAGSPVEVSSESPAEAGVDRLP